MRHLRLRRFILLPVALSLLALGETGICQSTIRRGPWSAANVNLQVNSKELTLTIPLARPRANETRAHVQLKLMNPDDLVRAQVSEDVEVVPRQKQVVAVTA